MSLSTWFAELAWLPGGVAEDVTIVADGEVITTVKAGSRAAPGARRLPGLVLPGLANAHSHAFHRALRGRTEAGSGSFWSWRETMYKVAGRLDPDRYRRLATAVYAEMALAGITAVGEFHYLHHAPGGVAYDQPNVMQEALAEAAAQVGIRITLLDTCFLRGGFEERLTDQQRRFSDGDAQAWAERASARRADPHVRLGAAIHSVRAVDPTGMEVVRDWAATHAAPLHVHVSEQPAENDACRAATGLTPPALLSRHGVLGEHTTAIHATHLEQSDIALLGGSGTGVCLCPTTERFLADGIGPGAALVDGGSPLSLGSDSHAVIDLLEEARAVELHERLVSNIRGSFEAEALLTAATSGGMAALGWDAGRIAPGCLCDLIALDTTSPRLAGFTPEAASGFAVFAATAQDVTHVVGGGRMVVEHRRHYRLGPETDVAARLQQAIEEVSQA